MWNGKVPVGETKSNHAVMPTDSFVTEYQHYSFTVKKSLHTFQIKKKQVTVQTSKMTTLPKFKVISPCCPKLEKK
jgi:hypothetical protein